MFLNDNLDIYKNSYVFQIEKNQFQVFLHVSSLVTLILYSNSTKHSGRFVQSFIIYHNYCFSNHYTYLIDYFFLDGNTADHSRLAET